MDNRPTKSQTYMAIAREWALRSTCSNRVAVGAVLVDSNGRIIASGYNGAPRGFAHCDTVGCVKDDAGHCMVAVHAEMNAIIQAANSGTNCRYSTLYVTHAPCVKCAMALIQAGIIRIVYAQPYGPDAEQAFARMAFDRCGVITKLLHEVIKEEEDAR